MSPRWYHWALIFGALGLGLLSALLAWVLRPTFWSGLSVFVALVVLAAMVNLARQWHAWKRGQREAYGARWFD
jgi:uncharacterized membrane protein YqjE